MSDNLHPEGTHAAEVVDHGITKSQSGTEQVAIKFQTAHGYVTGWFPLTDRAVDYTIEKLVAIGFTGRSFSALNDGRCMVGKKCSITISHEVYEGKTRVKIKYVNPEGYEGMEIKRDEAAARSVSRFDALLRKINPVDAAATNRVDDPDDEEIPF